MLLFLRAKKGYSFIDESKVTNLEVFLIIILWFIFLVNESIVTNLELFLIDYNIKVRLS